MPFAMDGDGGQMERVGEGTINSGACLVIPVSVLSSSHPFPPSLDEKHSTISDVDGICGKHDTQNTKNSQLIFSLFGVR